MVKFPPYDPANDERSAREFYRYFRQKVDESSETYRPLSEAEFKGALGEFVARRSVEVGNGVRARWDRAQLSAKARGRSRPAESVRWPDTLPGEEPFTLTPRQIALGRRFFAFNKRTAAQADAELRRLSLLGPNDMRKTLARARKASPQVKATFDLQTIVLEVVPYRASRQFLWACLRHEALESHSFGYRHLRENAKELAKIIAKEYRFLGLSHVAIAQGFKNKHQPDIDTAKRFGLSVKNGGGAVRKLLSISVSAR